MDIMAEGGRESILLSTTSVFEHQEALLGLIHLVGTDQVNSLLILR